MYSYLLHSSVWVELWLKELGSGWRRRRRGEVPSGLSFRPAQSDVGFLGE